MYTSWHIMLTLMMCQHRHTRCSDYVTICCLVTLSTSKFMSTLGPLTTSGTILGTHRRTGGVTTNRTPVISPAPTGINYATGTPEDLVPASKKPKSQS